MPRPSISPGEKLAAAAVVAASHADVEFRDFRKLREAALEHVRLDKSDRHQLVESWGEGSKELPWLADSDRRSLATVLADFVHHLILLSRPMPSSPVNREESDDLIYLTLSHRGDERFFFAWPGARAMLEARELLTNDQLCSGFRTLDNGCNQIRVGIDLLGNGCHQQTCSVYVCGNCEEPFARFGRYGRSRGDRGLRKFCTKNCNSAFTQDYEPARRCGRRRGVSGKPRGSRQPGACGAAIDTQCHWRAPVSAPVTLGEIERPGHVKRPCPQVSPLMRNCTDRFQ